MPFRLIGELPIEWLATWWRNAALRHAAMRISFGEHEGVPYQAIGESCDLPIIEHDVQGLEEKEIDNRILAVHKSPQALERESAYSLHVFRRGANDRTLLMRSHHIITDLASEDMLFAELRDHLLRAREGVASLEPRAVEPTYPEFVARHLERLAGEEGAKLARFWKETLVGAPTSFEMPADRTRTTGVKPRGASFGFELLDGSSTARLRELCRAVRTSPFRILLTAYLTFLYRHTGQDEILVGVPADCRGAEFEQVVGNFINLMVVRGRVGRTWTFRELLAKTENTVRNAAAHRAYPFPMLVEQIDRQRQPGHSPVVQTSFNLTSLRRCPEVEGILWPAPGPRWRGELAGFAIEAGEPIPAQEGHFDLGLTAVEVGSRLVGELKYDAALFNRETIERFATRLTTLLKSATLAPDRRIGELTMLPDSERQLVQVAWNATEHPFTSTVCHRLIEEQVDRTPASVALRHASENMTYREMDDRANRLAHHLQQLGVGRDTLVGIYLPRSCDVVVAILAVLKAGGAYVPLDLASPAERLALMISDAKPAIIVTTTCVERNLPPDPRRLLLDADAAVIAAQSTARPASSATDRSLAYVIYTSGSTGTPKGVMIEHRGVCNLAESLARVWKLDGTSCVYCYASFGFDASVADIFPSLVSGATLHLGRGDGALAGEELHAFMRDAEITHVTLTPAVWASMPALPLPALRVAVSAGEACIPETVSIWGNGRTFFNNYGPTEITVCATVGECTRAESASAVGRPISNIRTYVLDEELLPVGIGVPGELCLGGVGVARGYLNRADLTASRFHADPFVPDARVYRTGDIARWRPDGTLEYLGRRDTQVKLRGHRIELGEIESILRQQTDVVDACALVHGSTSDRRVLVAYVTGRSGASLSTSALRTALVDALPEYMVPAHIVVIDQLPLTVSGKVDRTELARRELAAASSARRAPPATRLETEIGAIWARLLRLDGPPPVVGREDDFFALGGDSLLALLLTYEAGNHVGKRLAPNVLSSARTLEQFCRALEVIDEAPAKSVFVDLRSEPVAQGSTPTYFFPPAAADATIYTSLAHRMPTRARPFGVAVTGSLEGGALPQPHRSDVGPHPTRTESIAEQARYYATQIDETAPPGAVWLAGWSLGGVLAMSVAHELEARGRRVELVALIDSRLPRASGPTRAPSFFQVLPDLGAVGEALAGLPPPELERLGDAMLAVPIEQRAVKAVSYAREHGLDVPAQAVPAELAASLRSGARALEEHEATVVQASLLLLWSSHTRELEATTSWDRYTRGRVVERVVDGHHYSLLRSPVVDQVASAVAEMMAEVGALRT